MNWSLLLATTLIAFAPLGCWGSGCARGIADLPPIVRSDDDRQWLGAEAVDILAEATSVETFRIDPRGDREASELLYRSPIEYRGKKQGRRFTRRLVAAVLEASPPASEDYPDCIPEPGVGFRFRDRRRTVEVIVCLDCSHIYYFAQTPEHSAGRELNWFFFENRAIIELRALALEAFPDDQELNEQFADR